jgi:hypothetical protein
MTTTRNGESRQKSTKIPDPPILTDGSEPAYNDWSIKMKMKLEANLDHFPTLALQMGYVQSRLLLTHQSTPPIYSEQVPNYRGNV